MENKLINAYIIYFMISKIVIIAGFGKYTNNSLLLVVQSTKNITFFKNQKYTLNRAMISLVLSVL